ncbi:MAG: hypothetical protein FWE23_03000 [Chitinivibrionia bacterium]|nr:hypothetical protein [Chitinivibrionia bacterium]
MRAEISHENNRNLLYLRYLEILKSADNLSKTYADQEKISIEYSDIDEATNTIVLREFSIERDEFIFDKNGNFNPDAYNVITCRQFKKEKGVKKDEEYEYILEVYKGRTAMRKDRRWYCTFCPDGYGSIDRDEDEISSVLEKIEADVSSAKNIMDKRYGSKKRKNSPSKNLFKILAAVLLSGAIIVFGSEIVLMFPVK